jgi:hypothetical protein
MPKRPTWAGKLEVRGRGPFKDVKKTWAQELYCFEDLIDAITKTAGLPEDTPEFTLQYYNTEYNEVMFITEEDYVRRLGELEGKVQIVNLEWEELQHELKVGPTRVRTLPPAVKITINESWTGQYKSRHQKTDEVIKRFRELQHNDYIQPQTGDQFLEKHAPRELKYSCWWWTLCIVKTFCPCCCLGVGTINQSIYAHAGDYEHVQRSISDGNDVDERDPQGRTVLSVAFMKERSDIISLLLDNDADPNIRDKLTGLAPLHHCVAQEYNSGLERLLEYGNDNNGNICDLNIADDNGMTPLMLACRNGFIEGIVKIVREANYPDAPGRKVTLVENVRDTLHGWTPLFYAAQAGHLEICQYLMEEVEVNIHKLDKNKLNAAEVALKAGHGHVTSYLNMMNPHVFDPYDASNVDTR